ncbi:MAG: hypothetical protein RR688_09455, partial [Carnobacterium sp.]
MKKIYGLLLLMALVSLLTLESMPLKAEEVIQTTEELDSNNAGNDATTESQSNEEAEIIESAEVESESTDIETQEIIEENEGELEKTEEHPVVAKEIVDSEFKTFQAEDYLAKAGSGTPADYGLIEAGWVKHTG